MNQKGFGVVGIIIIILASILSIGAGFGLRYMVEENKASISEVGGENLLSEQSDIPEQLVATVIDEKSISCADELNARYAEGIEPSLVTVVFVPGITESQARSLFGLGNFSMEGMSSQSGLVQNIVFTVPEGQEIESACLFKENSIVESVLLYPKTSSEPITFESIELFMDQFKTCKPGVLDLDQSFVAIRYEILEQSFRGCKMGLKYTKNPNPEWIDKDLICWYDTTKPFEQAVGDMMESVANNELPGSDDCTGPLAEILRSL